MKIIYITKINSRCTRDIGFIKKVMSQYGAFNNFADVECDLVYTQGENVILKKSTGEENIIFKTSKLGKKINFYRKIDKKINLKKYDIAYYRYHLSNFDFLRFILKVKIKHIVEIVTYPYDVEMKKSKDILVSIWFAQDKFYRRYVFKNIERVVTFSKDNRIFGRKCIKISNGIDYENTTIVNREILNKKEINFTSVASSGYWHGLDRFLNSLEMYLEQNSSAQVKFNIVGEGVETPKLKQIVNDSKHLKDVVVFHGFKSGEELDVIYNETDIAVGSLGIHRIGLKEVQPLKNREYAAKGLPFIISFKDPDFEKQPFIFKTTNDEKLIDIEMLIKWYQNNEFNPKKIREYAKQFSWDAQMKFVIDAIEKKEN